MMFGGMTLLTVIADALSNLVPLVGGAFEIMKIVSLAKVRPQ